MKTGDEMKKKEAALSIVVGAIADIKLFEGQPSLLSEAYATTKAKIEQPHISDRASFFYHLIMLRLREEMMSDTIALKTEGTQQAKEEDLLDFYFNYGVYEENVNHVVEACEGGICSYDKAYAVLIAYEAYLREGTVKEGTVCDKPLSEWIYFCESIYWLQLGRPESFMGYYKKWFN